MKSVSCQFCKITYLLKVFSSPDDQFERAALQKREKDQVIITCLCTGHVDGDVSANDDGMQLLWNMVENFGYGDGAD